MLHRSFNQSVNRSLCIKLFLYRICCTKCCSLEKHTYRPRIPLLTHPSPPLLCSRLKYFTCCVIKWWGWERKNQGGNARQRGNTRQRGNSRGQGAVWIGRWMPCLGTQAPTKRHVPTQTREESKSSESQHQIRNEVIKSHLRYNLASFLWKS